MNKFSDADDETKFTKKTRNDALLSPTLTKLNLVSVLLSIPTAFPRPTMMTSIGAQRRGYNELEAIIM